MLRIFCFIFLLLSSVLSAQDTISVSALQERCRHEGTFQFNYQLPYLVSYHLTYNKKPYTGYASQEKGNYKLIVRVEKGRVADCRQFDKGVLTTHFARLAENNQLGVDSFFTAYPLLDRVELAYTSGSQWRVKTTFWSKQPYYIRTVSHSHLPKCNHRHAYYCTCENKGLFYIKDSLEVSYYPNGNVQYTTRYLDGQPYEETAYTQSGWVSFHRIILNGVTEGFYHEETANGITEGNYRDGKEVGYWWEKDTSGNIVAQYWYPPGARDYNFPFGDSPDSLKEFFPGGKLLAFEKIIPFYDTVFEDHKAYLPLDLSYKRVRREYYPDGKLQHVEFENWHGQDTITADYGPDGKIVTVNLFSAGFTRYFPNGRPAAHETSGSGNTLYQTWYASGQMKKSWGLVPPALRNGRCTEWDSAGTVLFDREYENGRFLKAYDSAYYKPDTAAPRIKKLLYDDAFDLLETSLLDSAYSLSARASRAWKNELLIPGNTLDSIVDALYAVYKNDTSKYAGPIREFMTHNQNANGFTDSLHYKRVVYHLFCSGIDTATWKMNCANGVLATGNRIFDSLVAKAGGKITAGWVGDYASRTGGYADLVFDAPVNSYLILQLSKRKDQRLFLGRKQLTYGWVPECTYYYLLNEQYIPAAQKQESVCAEIYVPVGTSSTIREYRVYGDGSVEFQFTTNYDGMHNISGFDLFEYPYGTHNYQPKRKKWFHFWRL